MNVAGPLSTSFRLHFGSLDGSPWSIGDGMAFTLQRQGTTALGAIGGGLGLDGVWPSAAVRLDAVGNTLIVAANGTSTAVALWPLNMNLRGGSVFKVDVAYDGAALTATLTDTASGTTATARLAVDLAAALGGSTAYAGFTGGTGVLAGNVDVLDWTLSGGAAATQPASPPPPANAAPTVTASAPSATVAGTTAALTATGADDAGEGGLTYAWTVVSGPGSVLFSATGTNAAKATTATFTRAGAYTLRVTATDAGGLTAAATVSVTVTPTLTAFAVTPGTATVAPGGTQAFAAAALDQFSQPMAVTGVTWTVTGGGTVTSAGVYTAPTSAATATVKAAVGGKTATATVTVSAPATGPTLAGLKRNGSAAAFGSGVRLTGGHGQAGSAFTTSAVDVSRFTTSFKFQLGSLDGSPWSMGDGMTFALQRQGAAAVGAAGSGLGFAGLTPAVGVAFNVMSNNVGLYGTKQTIDLYAAGLDLRSGHAFKADVSYDGSKLTVTLTDLTTGKAATGKFNVNLATALGATTAFAGFTAGTGSLAANVDVLDWTYRNE